MRAVGDAVGMSWGCDASSAYTSNGVDTLINEFGYSNAAYAGSNIETIKSEIRNGRPLVLRGCGSRTNYGLFIYENCHAWVCDGIKRYFYCDSGTSHLCFCMN